MLRFSLILLSLLFAELSFSADQETLKVQLLAQLPERPETVQQKIDDVFDQLKSQLGDSSGWHYNGTKGDYGLLGFDSFLLLEKFVKEHPDQEHFRVLDIGSAQYAYSTTLTEKILASPLCKGKNFTIVSLDGEENLKRGQIAHNEFNLEDLPEVTEIRVDRFKVENLYEELQRRNLPIDYDLIVSNWCLRHLCDPIRALWEAYAMLKQEGIFMTNGFFLTDSEKEIRFEGRQLFDFINTARIPCLLRYADSGKNIGDFALLKDKKLKQFPFEYTGKTRVISLMAQCYSKASACYRYKHETPRKEAPNKQTSGFCTHYWYNSLPLLSKIRPFLNIKDLKRTKRHLDRLRRYSIKQRKIRRDLKSKFLAKDERKSLSTLSRRLEIIDREHLEVLDFYIENFSAQERLARRAYEQIRRNILNGRASFKNHSEAFSSPTEPASEIVKVAVIRLSLSSQSSVLHPNSREKF